MKTIFRAAAMAAALTVSPTFSPPGIAQAGSGNVGTIYQH